jgi:single-strand DNA-binding protein
MTNAGQTYTTTGLVATTPRYIKTADGIDICSFRLASASKRFDPKKMEWIEADTNWFTITSFGNLAVNAVSSISKGDRIIVSGTLRVRDWDNGEVSGTSVEIEADTLGHDLFWGQSTFTRTTLTEPKPVIRPTSVPKEEPAIV